MRIAATVALVVVASACSEQSRVAPDASIRVTGTVRQADGSPAAGRPLHLGSGITSAELAFATFTVGAGCVVGACTGTALDGSTRDDGTYELTMRGSDTQSTFGEALPLTLVAVAATATGAVSPPSVSATFRAQTEHVQLPALDLVDPGLELGGDGGVFLRWRPDAPGPYDVVFETAEAIPTWRVTVGEPSAAVDPRVLEDSTGRVVVVGQRRDSTVGSDVDIRWRSTGLGYAGGLGPPPSRGAACRAEGAGLDPPGTSCPLTDGDLSTPWPVLVACPADAPTCPPATAAVVELAEAVPTAELVVVRGCASTCPLEVSADGATFHPVAAASGEFAAVPLAGEPVRAVRVGLPDPSARLQEVSVWGPPPDRPALTSEGSPQQGSGPTPYGDEDDDPPWPLVAAAAVAATGVVAGLGFAAGRRRRTTPAP